MSKQVNQEETLSKRSVDNNSPTLIPTKKARTEHSVQSVTSPFEAAIPSAAKESNSVMGTTKENFSEQSRKNQIVSQVFIFC